MNLKYYLALIVLIVLLSCNSQTNSNSIDIAIPVSVEDIKLKSIEQIINTTGTVTAENEVILSTQSEGKYLIKTNSATGKTFALGDKVYKGQTIIEVNSEEYINSIGLEAKKLNLSIAELIYKKQKSLYDKGGVTQSELSDAEVSLVNAKDSYKLAQIQMEKVKVIAPFDGVITNLPNFTQGVTVPSGTEVLTIMDYKNLLLEINLPEKYINNIAKNQSVRVMNYTLPEDTLIGMVMQISPSISTETRTFLCKLEIRNPDLLLRPGMFVQADIILDAKHDVVVIPKDIVISNRKGKVVYTVSKSTANMVNVTFGYENGNMVEITSGLKANDRLVIKGFETLRDQSKVKIVK